MNQPRHPASHVLQIWLNRGGGDEHPMNKTELTLGRSQDNDIVLDDPQISGHHARLFTSTDSFFVMDLGSLNGTELNGQALAPRVAAPFGPGDVITFGEFNVSVRPVSAEAPAPPAVAENVKIAARPQPGLSLYAKQKLVKYALGKQPVTIGRASDNTITVDHPQVIRLAEEQDKRRELEGKLDHLINNGQGGQRSEPP